MATRHTVLSQDEFRALKHGKPKPLSKMKIGAGAKSSILKKAKKLLGKHAPTPLHRFVVCHIRGDSVVCYVLGAGHKKHPPKKKKR